MTRLMMAICCLFLASCAHTPADVSWDELLESHCTGLDEISLTEPNNRDAIISHAYIDTPREVLAEMENIIHTEGYDPILFEIYLAYKLVKDSDDKEILPLILEYVSNDTDNAIPLYFLSYYYAQKEKYDDSINYLRQGNLRKQCQLYIKKKKKILFDYVLKETDNELAAYSSQFIIHNSDLYIVLRRLSTKLMKNNIADVKPDEIAEIGQKFEQESISVIDKLVSLAIQMCCIDKNVDTKRYEFLDRKYEYYRSLVRRHYDERGKEKLILYLKTVFEHGEVYALEQLDSP